MAVIAEKLYPPTISESIPAFYREGKDGAANITVPFFMNRAVNTNEIWGYIVKIKTIQTNEVLFSISSSIIEFNRIMNNFPEIDNKIKFQINSNQQNFFNKIKIGQFLKIQVAYIRKKEINNDNTIDYQPENKGDIGYYSNVGIIKYTDKPTIYIKEYKNNSNDNIFYQTCTGVYGFGEDKMETPYFYKFSLYEKSTDENEYTLIEPGEWLLWDNNSLECKYTFKTFVDIGKKGRVKFEVKTINNLEGLEIEYDYTNSNINEKKFPLFPFKLKAKNNFDNGYIQLYFEFNSEEYSLEKSDEDFYIKIYKKDSNNLTYLLKKIQLNYENIKEWHFEDFDIEQGVFYTYFFRQYNNNNLYSEEKYSNEVAADFEDMFLYDGEKQLKIRFNPKVSSFKINRLESKTDTIGSKYPYISRNGNVEYKEFPISGLISYHMDNDELFVNYKEDLNILSDKDSEREETPTKQNLYVSNIYYYMNNGKYFLDTNDTITKDRVYYQPSNFINNQPRAYLYYTKNNKNYLLDYKYINNEDTSEYGPLHFYIQTGYTIEDGYTYEETHDFRENEIYYEQVADKVFNMIQFEKYQPSLYYYKNNQEFIIDYDIEPAQTWHYKIQYEEIDLIVKNKPWETTETLNLVSNNIYSERKFKMLLLDWLGNGKVKMFKSPTEGNYLVRLMNISLSPEDRLSRMLHNFSCTAYEVEEINYNNLLKFGFLNETGD